MALVSVSCGHCGAPLDVAAGVRFLTCNYCGSRLEVHRTDSSTYTAALETIEEHASQMARELGTIRLQNELEQLDRQWAMERESLMVHGKDGSPREPTGGAAGMIAGLVFLAFFVVVCIGMGMAALSFAAAWHGPSGPGIFALVPFGMAIMAVVAFVSTMASQCNKANRYAERQQAYQARRGAILAQLGERRGESRQVSDAGIAE